MATQPSNSNILALDVGAARIGVALAHSVARLPHPLATLANSPEVLDEVAQLVASEEVGEIVVGLPRNLGGDDTAQTASVREFAKRLAARVPVPITLQDEALTSVKAEDELRKRGGHYSKGDIDALAATYILEDYLSHNEGKTTL